MQLFDRLGINTGEENGNSTQLVVQLTWEKNSKQDGEFVPEMHAWMEGCTGIKKTVKNYFLYSNSYVDYFGNFCRKLHIKS